MHFFDDRINCDRPFFDIDTIECTVPFLTNFVNPRRVFFGSYNQFTGICQQVFREYSTLIAKVPSYDTHERLCMLIDGISGALRVGVFPPTLELKGLQCPYLCRQ